MSRKLNQDAVAGALLLLGAAMLYVQTGGIPQGGALWPRIVLVVLAMLAASIVVRGVVRARRGREDHEGEGERLTLRLVASPLAVVGLTLAYLVLLSLIGFFPATVAFLAAYLRYERVRSWKVYAFVVGGVNVFVYLLFVQQLNVQLPAGLLFS